MTPEEIAQAQEVIDSVREGKPLGEPLTPVWPEGEKEKESK